MQSRLLASSTKCWLKIIKPILLLCTLNGTYSELKLSHFCLLYILCKFVSYLSLLTLAGTPPLPGRYTPLGGRYTPWAGIPPMAGAPPWQVHPPGQVHSPEQCMLGDTGNKRAVRILLECILVLSIEPSLPKFTITDNLRLGSGSSGCFLLGYITINTSAVVYGFFYFNWSLPPGQGNTVKVINNLHTRQWHYTERCRK